MFSALHSSVYHETHDTTVIDSVITDIVMEMNVEVNSCCSVSIVDRRQEVVRCNTAHIVIFLAPRCCTVDMQIVGCI